MIESKYGLVTVYGDTDSLFIDLNRRVTKSNLGEIVDFSKAMAAVVTKKFNCFGQFIPALRRSEYKKFEIKAQENGKNSVKE